MGGESKGPTGPDLRRGIRISELPASGMIAGHVGEHHVLLARVGDELLAIGATCTHYGGPLAEGLIVGDTVRCPWHHACFSLRTGVPLGAPALWPVRRWAVERRDELVCVTHEVAHPEPPDRDATKDPEAVVIVGGGPAADAAADMLRRRGYQGSITMISEEGSPPVDRPNLSKDYLAGDAPEEWIPLRPADFYQEQEIRLVLGKRVAELDMAGRTVRLDDGGSVRWGALLLATGASPVRLAADVDPEQRALYLRSLADSRAIIEAAGKARRAAVLGASFIGLEVAASLRARGLEVHVAAPESRPLERVMGQQLGDFVRGLHESKGVRFHLGRKAQRVDAQGVTLDDGTRIDAELVVAGIGVRPREELAARAGIQTDKGILVDAQLRTSAAGVWSAGDVARYPDARTGARIRVEHWVVAQRMGQCAARNILGAGEAFADVPFFWSRHFDTAINYVGHAETWDRIEIEGDLGAQDCTVRYHANGRVLAAATVGRDHAGLEAEAAMEKEAHV